MQAPLLLLVLTALVGQTAPVPPPPLAPAPSLAPVPAPGPAALGPTPDAAPAAQPDNGVVPNAGFSASRYENLWTKSPFAVATSEDPTDTSPDYELVGIANIDGVSFASLIDRQNQEHFLISSDKASRGLTLTSITRSHDGSDTFAVVQKDGQPITLKLEIPTAVAANAPAGQPGAMPQIMTPQISMPGAGGNFPGGGGGSVRPFTRFHRPLIHLPPQPGVQPQPPTQPQTPPNAEAHPTPPPPQ